MSVVLDPQAEGAAPARAADRRIHVLHLLHTVAYGGIETAILNWVQRMDRERFHVQLACFDNGDGGHLPFVEAARARGLAVATIPWSRAKPVLRAARALVRLVDEHAIDIVHTHNPYADFTGLAASWMRPVRTITTAYVWDDLGFKRNVLQWLDRLAMRRFDRVSAHCEETWRRTVAYGFPGEEVETLICGYDVAPVALTAEERREGRAAFGAGDDDIVIANVARLYPEKAQDLMLRCFARIAAREPRARLWIAGVGPSEGELRALCSRLGLDGRVRFVGFVKELERFMPLVDIQWDPARAAGVALAICSGMAAGVPIVAADVGGLREVLKPGRTGVLVPKDDERGYEEAILRLAADPAERRRIGGNARDFLATEYSLATAVARVERTYRAMMA